MDRLSILCCVVLFITNGLFAQSAHEKIASPDKKINFSLFLDQRQLYYRISYNNEPVINSSTLGLTVNDQEVGKGSAFRSIEKNVVREAYPWRGVHIKATNHYRSARIAIRGTNTSPSFILEVRVFNDGVAFRYLIHESGKNIINADNTEFSIPDGCTIWSQEDINDYEGAYRQQKIAEVHKGQKAGPPLTIQLPGDLGYAAITEGGGG